MRKLIPALLLILCCVSLVVPLQAQGRLWDGADSQPTHPLACDAESSAEIAAGRYNGTQPFDPPQMAGKPITLVNIPRLLGSSYSNAVDQGMQQAAKELRTVTVTTDAPAKANSSDQVIYIENYISRAVDGIFVAVNDPAEASSALRDALDAGVHVLTYGSDANGDSREWYLSPAAVSEIAKMLVDQMALQTGSSGRFAIVTNTFKSAYEARIMAEMEAYAQQCFPGMEWLETVEAQEDPVLAFNQAANLLNSYGEDLNGLFGLTTTVTPSIAEAVSRSGRCGSVAVVGLGMPEDMKPYISGSCVRSAVLWSPLDLGYAAVYVMRAIVDGSFGPGDSSVNAGRLGALPVTDGSHILLGPPLLMDAQNIDRLNF